MTFSAINMRFKINHSTIAQFYIFTTWSILQADKKVPGNFGSDISAYYEFMNNIDMLVENAFR